MDWQLLLFESQFKQLLPSASHTECRDEDPYCESARSQLLLSSHARQLLPLVSHTVCVVTLGKDDAYGPDDPV